VSPVRYELRFHIPEDGILHSHRRGNLKSYKFTMKMLTKRWAALNTRRAVAPDAKDACYGPVVNKPKPRIQTSEWLDVRQRKHGTAQYVDQWRVFSIVHGMASGVTHWNERLQIINTGLKLQYR
jgi:hypothetical protein